MQNCTVQKLNVQYDIRNASMIMNFSHRRTSIDMHKQVTKILFTACINYIVNCRNS